MCLPLLRLKKGYKICKSYVKYLEDFCAVVQCGFYAIHGIGSHNIFIL